MTALMRLMRWLGPWADPGRAPDCSRESIQVAGPRGPFEAWVYRPARGARRAWLISPGLHPLGPTDPRLDRFCRILAHAGAEVLCPFLPDYLGLRIAPTAPADLRAAFEALVARTGGRPAVFSLSFGSFPALALASDPATSARIGALVTFGAFCDLARTMRFCLTGLIDGQPFGAHDPLNRPAIYINLVEDLVGMPDDRDALVAAWLRYVHATWGRPEMKADERWPPVAREIAAELPENLREPFLLGCGLGEGGLERCLGAMERRGDRNRFVDPRPRVGRIACPVYLFHGMDDDVIPYTESVALGEAFPPGHPVEVHLTGLYGHTGTGGASARAVARELRTMVRMLQVLAREG